MAISKSSPGAQKIEDRVTQIYQVAKQNPEDANLQEAVSLIKSLRRSQGALQGWNGRYKEEKGGEHPTFTISKYTQGKS